MAWSEIKHAINSRLGGGNFKPIDQLIDELSTAVAAIKTDVAAVKTDVAGVKATAETIIARGAVKKVTHIKDTVSASPFYFYYALGVIDREKTFISIQSVSLVDTCVETLFYEPFGSPGSTVLRVTVNRAPVTVALEVIEYY